MLESECKTSRPTRRNGDILTEVANEIHGNLIDGGFASADNRQEELDSLVKALKGSDFDGFELGKTLDRDGWEINASVVDILDQAWSLTDYHTRKMTEHWVRFNQIEPKYKVGDVITVGGRQRTVIDIDTKAAEYHLSLRDGRPNGCELVHYRFAESAT